MYQAYISCGQVDKPNQRKAIERLQKIFGGSIYSYKQPMKNKTHLNTVTWQVVSKQAENCAELLLPHLVIKKEQARLLLDFSGSLVDCRGNTKLRKQEEEKRDNYWWKMRKLNVKGKLRLQRLSDGTVKTDAIV
jgi:hypothetical protein